MTSAMTIEAGPDERVRDDQGIASTWVILSLPPLIVFSLVSVALWSGYTDRRHLAEMAEAAARSGANAIEIEVFNETGRLQLNEDEARLLAGETLALQDRTDIITGASIDIVDGQVIVRLTGTTTMPIIGTRPVSVEAAAAPQLASGVANEPSRP